MEQVIVVHKEAGPVACLLGPRMEGGMTQSCNGCQAYSKDDLSLCLSVDVDCTLNGGEVLAAIKLNGGTRFEAITQNGVHLKDALVHSIVEWREHPYTVYWTDQNGKHIEQYALHNFKKFKFL